MMLVNEVIDVCHVQQEQNQTKYGALWFAKLQKSWLRASRP